MNCQLKVNTFNYYCKINATKYAIAKAVKAKHLYFEKLFIHENYKKIFVAG